MLHSMHFDMPVLTNICGGMGVGVMTPDGDVIGCDGDICCALVASFVADDDNRKASSMLCLTSNCGGMTFIAGSDKRKAISAGSSGRIRWFECEVEELGEMEMLLPRGLCDRRLGDGVRGGDPGNEGAHTICSGVIESPLTDRFSLPSIIASNSMRNWSAEIADESERLRSREFEPGDIRRTERSRGVEVSLLEIFNK